MKKLLFTSLFIVSVIGLANAETVTAKVAATSYVQGAAAERVYAQVNKDVNNANAGNMVTNVELENLDNDATKKVIKVTTSNVQIPVGGASTSSYAPIWIE